MGRNHYCLLEHGIRYFLISFLLLALLPPLPVNFKSWLGDTPVNTTLTICCMLS